MRTGGGSCGQCRVGKHAGAPRLKQHYREHGGGRRVGKHAGVPRLKQHRGSIVEGAAWGSTPGAPPKASALGASQGLHVALKARAKSPGVDPPPKLPSPKLPAWPTGSGAAKMARTARAASPQSSNRTPSVSPGISPRAPAATPPPPQPPLAAARRSPRPRPRRSRRRRRRRRSLGRRAGLTHRPPCPGLFPSSSDVAGLGAGAAGQRHVICAILPSHVQCVSQLSSYCPPPEIGGGGPRTTISGAQGTLHGAPGRPPPPKPTQALKDRGPSYSQRKHRQNVGQRLLPPTTKVGVSCGSRVISA